MASDKAFTIDDALSTADNLAAYSKALEAIDAPLAAALNSYLSTLAAGHAVDPATIWDTLYKAAEPETKASEANAPGAAS